MPGALSRAGGVTGGQEGEHGGSRVTGDRRPSTDQPPFLSAILQIRLQAPGTTGGAAGTSEAGKGVLVVPADPGRRSSAGEGDW